MIDRAKEKGVEYPAINVTSSANLNAGVEGFNEGGPDGVVQISSGGGECTSGQTVKDMVTGAVALAEYAHVVAKNYPINVALHTDHCQKEKLDKYVNPLIAISQERVDKGQDPLFNSHMWDGSAIEVEENLQIAEELLSRTAKAKLILE
ncbi:class II fructose-bisphosphate aldolase, partial [Clostridioides difficile]|nr:class II fructose-bisphosphate aldolase [Clostridioides difficile]